MGVGGSESPNRRKEGKKVGKEEGTEGDEAGREKDPWSYSGPAIKTNRGEQIKRRKRDK